MKFKIFACAAAAFLAACSSVDVKENTYPIGVILPLSGELAGASGEVLKGMEIARDEINAAGGVAGIPLDIVSRDADSENMPFLENFDAMRANGIKVFCLGFGRETISRKRLINSCDDAFVNFMCTYPPMTLDSDNSTRIFLNGAQAGDLMATAVARDGETTVRLVVMNEDNFEGKADADYLGFDLKINKTKLYRDVFGRGEKKFDVFSSQIMRLDPDYVFYVGTGLEFDAFTQSLKSAGYSKTIVSNCGVVDNDVKSSDGVKVLKVATLFEQGKIDTPASKKFVEKYRAKFGKAPTWRAAYGYDSIKLLAAAAEKSRFIPKKMRDCFKNIEYDGAVGKIKFDASADSLSELSLVNR